MNLGPHLSAVRTNIATQREFAFFVLKLRNVCKYKNSSDQANLGVE